MKAYTRDESENVPYSIDVQLPHKHGPSSLVVIAERLWFVCDHYSMPWHLLCHAADAAPIATFVSCRLALWWSCNSGCWTACSSRAV